MSVITEKINALLRKAERSDSTWEAEAFTAKALELMVKHAVDQSMLDASRDPEKKELIIRSEVIIQAPYAKPKVGLLAGVADVFKVRAVYLGGLSERSTKVVALVGFESDIEMAKTMYASLVIQMDAAMNNALVPYGSNTKSFRVGFMIGFSQTAYSRMKDYYNTRVTETPGMGLVLADKSKKVSEAVAQEFGVTRKGSISRGSLSGSQAGNVAGQKADIGQTRMANNQALH